MNELCGIGMVGLGTMGRNLALNMADHGFLVAGLDLDTGQVQAMADESGGCVLAFGDAASFVKSLAKPRAVMIMVPAGGPVDAVIQLLVPLLEPGDILIDGGNSFFRDTERRRAALAEQQIEFIGVGVSGGEEGARHGPSMMAGGTESSYARVAPILEAIGAKASDGQSCVGRMGSGAAGHYVKMVHNGIEYGMMQLIAEAYDFVRRAGDATNDEAADAFTTWSKGAAGGYLLEITAEVLAKRDGESEEYLVDVIVDGAKQKGTGKWTSQDAMDLGVPIPTIDAAVSARQMSGYLLQRQAASKVYGRLPMTINPDWDRVGDALHAAFLLTFAQGFSVLARASAEYGFGLDFAKAASVWREGCIIRCKLLPAIRDAFSTNPSLANLLMARPITETMQHLEGSLRWIVAEMARARVPAPAFSASLAYLDSYTSGRLPANLIQGLRDCFGAHGYERIDKPGTFHSEWGLQNG